jgi:hypothetical protein
LLNIGSPTGPFAKDESGSADIERISIRLSDVRIRENELTLRSANVERHFDVAYLALGYCSQHELARALGANCAASESAIAATDIHNKLRGK